MDLFFTLLFFLGIAFGSFINVLSMRYKPEDNVFSKKNIGGRSHCISCKKKLTWYELIPIVSFLFQGGRCRNCNTKLTLQYPFVEIISGIIFISIPFFLNNFFGIPQEMFITFNSPLWYYIVIFLWVFIFLILFLILLIDLKYYVIPDELNLLLIIFGITIFTIFFFHIKEFPIFSNSFLKQYSFFLSPTQNIFISHLLGAIIAGGFFFILHIITKGKGMGFGDVKLAFSLGVIFGLPDILFIILLAFIFGGLLGLYLIMAKLNTMKGKVPFAPFLVIGSIITFFLGFNIFSIYLNFFGL